jgi:hypothetical protein
LFECNRLFCTIFCACRLVAALALIEILSNVVDG